ncbi:MAG TPA: orotidine-5'-phosphate decarboxylase [Methylomirabilota bacterium]|nr:orotidine-5'-phosphate decarboxylase [Methylomirabilota bacterium]
MPPSDPKDRLIVALDVDQLGQAESLLDRLSPRVSTFKIGSQLFTAAGPAAVEIVQKRGGRVFLDLKYHDIPNSVAGAVREAARLGVFMLNVHASGGGAMMSAAAQALREEAKGVGARPMLLAVTVLTSLDRAALQRELNVPLSVEGHALHLARLAQASGLDGSVASPQEVRTLRNALGRDWVIVTPGVRPSGGSSDDQARVATPEAAIRAGADYLVVGRPILEASDPEHAAQAFVASIAAASK